MRISACYIVRNEAAKLARSLDSLRGTVDEIIVVDTGSTDDTVSVAEEHGARVFHFPWRDDFAAARNVSLSKATGDWILVVDADEYFAGGMAGNIRRVVETYGKEADLLLFLRRELDEDEGKVLLDSYVPRLLRRVDGLAYEGAIHEEPRHQGKGVGRVGTVPAGELLMMHTGYSTAISKAKGERNLALLQKELAGGRARDSIYMYLAETYDGLGDEENALKYAWLDVNSGRKAFAFSSRAYRILLRILAKRPEAYRDRRKAAAIAVKDFPELPEFHAEYAECLGYGMDYRGAVMEDRKALELFSGRSISGLEPTTFTRETAEFVKDRMEMWAEKAREEADEEPLRDKAAVGDWQGLFHLTDRIVWKRGIELLSLLILMESDASELARAASDSTVKLLPPSMAKVWQAYIDGATANSMMEETYAEMIGDLVRRTGARGVTRFASFARTFSPKRRHEVARRLAEEEAWGLALPLLEDAEDAEELLLRGICLYHLGDGDSARRTLLGVRESNDSPEAESYLRWLKEAAFDA
ncbi:MAG: glycosyltransferase family 2 protein [Schwartzia sp.]|nr:glycosyltransferase family 2 protein [Schwartzia sp. (in: firmicutes)]MBR1886308.1 glycosyltransferase family 2 protein [Schwartzia sp. (in: firmicutes)]